MPEQSRTPLSFWVAYGLVIYLPLEEFLLKASPVPDDKLFLVRFGSEVLLYVTLLAVVLARLPVTLTSLTSGSRRFDRLKLQNSPIDLLVPLFILLALLSVLINGSSLPDAIFNIRNLLRYLTVFLIMVNLDLQPWQVRLTLNTIVVMAGFESLLGMVQFVLGDNFTAFFEQRTYELTISKSRVSFPDDNRKLGAAIGTCGREAAMAYFVMLAGIVLAARGYRKHDLVSLNWTNLLMLLLLAGCFVTYKRGSLLLLLAAIPLVFAWQGRFADFQKSFVKLLVPGLVLGSLFFSSQALLSVQNQKFVDPKSDQISPAEQFALFFNEDYWNNANDYSRGWFLRDVGTEAVLSFHRPLGLSADEEFAKERLAEKGGSFRKIPFYRPFDDVYWVAILIYYGYAGLFVFGLMLVRLYRACRSLFQNTQEEEYRQLAIAMGVLLLITIVFTFLERSFEVRTYGYYFWLLAGMVVAACRANSLPHPPGPPLQPRKEREEPSLQRPGRSAARSL